MVQKATSKSMSSVASRAKSRLASRMLARAAHSIALDLRHPRLVMLLEGIARTKGSGPA